MSKKRKHNKLRILLVASREPPGSSVALGAMEYCRARWQANFHLVGEYPNQIRMQAQWKPDGVIGRIGRSTTEEAVASLGVPTINVSTYDQNTRFPRVAWDDAAVGRLVAEYFLDRGYRQFAFIGNQHAWAFQLRCDAFVARLTKAGFSCDIHKMEFTTTWPGQSVDMAYQEELRLRQFLRGLTRPAAIMCENDWASFPVLEACRLESIAVPEDISVVGVDNNLFFCQICDPPLSSVDLCSEQVGRMAAVALDRLLSGKRVPPIQLSPNVRLVTRRSSDSMAISDSLVSKAAIEIHDRACHGLTVKELASEVGCSRRVFEVRFQKAFGRTPLKEIHRVRIERARNLLVNTDLTILEIASMCGFDYLAHFGALFRKHTGMTPRQYRRKMRGIPSLK
jgi:LacI family transcriptional regulator